MRRFLLALRKAQRDYHDAFTGPGEIRQDQPTAPALLAIMSKYIEQSPDRLRKEVGYVDRDGQLDIRDIYRQIAWFKAQNLVKADVDADTILDKRFIIPLH